jgi:hypothetical protein
MQNTRQLQLKLQLRPTLWLRLKMQLKGHNGTITYRDGSLHIENTKLQS